MTNKLRRLVCSAAVVFLATTSFIGIPNQLSAQRSPNIPVDEQGHSCIVDVRKESKEQPTQRGMWGHKVFATNRCNRIINLTVCYKKSRVCTNLTATPGAESPTSLGVKPYRDFYVTYELAE
jgi:hypothetical protein